VFIVRVNRLTPRAADDYTHVTPRLGRPRGLGPPKEEGLLRSNALGGNGAAHHRSKLRIRMWTALVASATLVLSGVAGATAASAQTHPVSAPVHQHVTGHLYAVPGHHNYKAACAAATTGHFSCFALVRTGLKSSVVRPDQAPSGDGYGPSTLQAAYNLPSSTDGSGETVALVDAYNDPDITSDLATYRSDWGLPACGSGCFSVVNEEGETSPLPSNAGSNGWDVEESLDVDMVSAICPLCHIILVEANSASNSDLGTAVNAAVSLGAMAVSNSYGGSESSEDTTYDTEYYQHPGVAVTASAGDDGYGVSYPAASQYVTSVGGTTLSTASNSRGYTETVWGSSSGGEGTGSGCSAYDPKPSWQTDTGCSKRTDNDVAADANPDTGVAVYDSYSEGGWLEVGGTSESSPIIAATFALAGKPASGTYPSSYPYAHTSDLYPVTSGANGTCSPTYLCTAGTGYNGPAGWGTPDGIGAFSSSSSSNTVTVTNPGNQTGTVGTAVSLQIKATDSASGQTLTYSATGLPAGLSINSSSGLISGTPTTAGDNNVTVTATDTTGASGSASFTWDISSSTGNTVTVTNPGNQTGTVGTAVSLQIKATDSASGQTLTYSATGLPAGLTINSSSGLISGTPTTAADYNVTVTATDTTGASGSASFTWDISAASSCTSQQLIQNGGFQSGSLSPWTATSGVLADTDEGVPSYPTSDPYLAWLDGYGGAHTDTLAQTVTIPAGCTAGTLTFWLYINSDDPTNKAYDTFTTQILNSSGTVLSTLSTLSNQNESNGYVEYSYSIGNYAGQTITIKFTGKETLGDGYNTNFFEDDNSLNVS
jgi:subtilase family serine protease